MISPRAGARKAPESHPNPLRAAGNLLTAKEAAAYLGISYNTLKRDWPAFDKYGVVPCRYRGGRILLFKKSELDQMIEKWRVSR